MHDILFLVSPDLLCAAEEAGIGLRVVDDPSTVIGEVQRAAKGGCSLLFASEDLVAGQVREVEEAAGRARGKMTLLTVPMRADSKMAFLHGLRTRFAVAIGLDVWKMTAQKAGVDF